MQHKHTQTYVRACTYIKITGDLTGEQKDAYCNRYNRFIRARAVRHYSLSGFDTIMYGAHPFFARLADSSAHPNSPLIFSPTLQCLNY